MENSSTRFIIVTSPDEKCSCCDMKMKKNALLPALKQRTYSSSSKRTAFYFVALLLATCTDITYGAGNSGNCPSVCSCSKENRVFCNNKGLTVTPTGFGPNPEELYLFNNNISSILTATLKPLKNLKILDVSGNRLSDIALWDGIFTKLKLLENLMLQDNRITRINRGMFKGLNNLARIYLSNNQIDVIEPGSFDTLPNLIELKLQNNRISRFPRLNHTPKLLLLDLSSNRLTTLRDMAFSTVNVEQLMLRNNRLTELRTSVFDDTSRLTQLDISDNRLTAVPQVVKSLTSLRTLNISFNKLEAKTIPQDTFANLESLKSLYLRKMGLQTLPSRIIPTGTVILNVLDLRDNEWDCKCKMRWLPAYIKRFSVAIITPDGLVCSQSSTLRGRKIMNLKETNFGCTREELDSIANGESTTSEPSTTSPGRSFINPCDVYYCGNNGTCYVERNIPKCRCTKGWSGPQCLTSLITTTSTRVTPTTRRRITWPNRSPATPRPRLMINPSSITEETVEILIPIRNRELLLSIKEIGKNQPPNEFHITPKAQFFTVKNLDSGRSYNICIHLPLTGARASRRSNARRDTLCGIAKTKGVKIANTPASKPDITVVPSPKVTTKSSGAPNQKGSNTVTKSVDASLSDPSHDEKLHGNKMTAQTEPADSGEFSILYPAIAAGIGAVVVIIIVIMFCICKRQKRLLKLKKSPSADYTPGSATDTHNDVEMATVVHHHHHNHYNAGSIEANNISKSGQNSPSSTMQNGSTPSNGYNPKMSPSKTNNNHSIVQSKSSRSSSRSSGVSQPEARYTSVQPSVTKNPLQKYEQNGIPNGYNIYRGHEASQEPKRQSVHRQVQSRPQNVLPNNDTQPILSGNSTYYGANDSHLYPVSPLGSPTYNIPSTGGVPYNPPGHNTHALFQPIQSPLASSPGESIPGLNLGLSGSHGLPPAMACFNRNLVVDNMPLYHDGVQVV